MTGPEPDFLPLLRTLIQHQVDFIVVGGVAAVLNGAPLTTFDLDVVHSRTPENLARLLAALLELHAYYREPGDRRLAPRIPFLEGAGHSLLHTDAGQLDVLGTIGSDEGYNELLPHCLEIEVADVGRIRVLDLPTLIRVKEHAARPKDIAVLPLLRATLQEHQKGKPNE